MFATLPDGTKLFYDCYGSQLVIHKDGITTRPTLIVLHGGPGGDHSIYVSFWEQLSELAQVVFLDMRGHGRSDDSSKNKWNLAQWGQDIHDFIEATGIENPIVAGISFGGWVTLSYATQFPNHAAGLILCNTEARVDVSTRMQEYRRIGKIRGQVDLGERAAQVVAVMAEQADAESAQDYANYCFPLFSNNPYQPFELDRVIRKLGPWQQFNKHEYYSFDYLDQVGKINTPTLYLCGENDPEHPWVSAQQTANRMKADLVSFHKLNNAGDPVYRDAPELTLKILTEFIENINQKNLSN